MKHLATSIGRVQPEVNGQTWGHKASGDTGMCCPTRGGSPALLCLCAHKGDRRSKGLWNCSEQKVLLCALQAEPDCGSYLPLTNTSWCPEPITKGWGREKEGIFNNETVINPDRHAALRTTFQLLVVGGQIIPFHHISLYCTSPRYIFSWNAVRNQNN